MQGGEMKLKWSVWGCGVCMASMALGAFGVSCSGPEEEERSGSEEFTIEGPSRAESVAFLKALQAMKFSRSDAEGLAPIRWFEDSSIEEARDTADWEGSWVESPPTSDRAVPFKNKFGLGLLATGQGSNPQSALLSVLNQYASFVMSNEPSGNQNVLYEEGLAVSSSSGDPEVIKLEVGGKLGPFDYASQEKMISTFDPTALTTSSAITERYRYSRSGKIFSCTIKTQITDSEAGSSSHIKFTSKPAGLELTDIVRGLVEDPASRFSFVFLSDKAGEVYEVHMTAFPPKKK